MQFVAPIVDYTDYTDDLSRVFDRDILHLDTDV